MMLTIIQALKANVKAPIHLHSHFTSGMGDSRSLRLWAGVDIIDTCTGPMHIAPLTLELTPGYRSLGNESRYRHGYQIAQHDRQEMEKDIPKYMQFADTTKFPSSIQTL